MKNCIIVKNSISFDDELYIRSKINHYKNSAAWLHKTILFLGEDRASFIIKNENLNIIGFLIIKKSESKICSFFVDPSFRNSGYGKFLLDIAKKEINNMATIHFNMTKNDNMYFFIEHNAYILKNEKIEDENYLLFSFK